LSRLQIKHEGQELVANQIEQRSILLTMNNLSDSKWAGRFTVPPHNEIYGELTVSGQNTSLYLRAKDDEISRQALEVHSIKGVLHDLTKVSLLNCILISGPGYMRRGNETCSFANIFPHFVVHGNDYIEAQEKAVTEIHLTVDDATTLFYDFDAFGLLMDARPFIDDIVKANSVPRVIRTGPDPQICYFTGRREIFAAETIIGKISASHCPSYAPGGPNGVHISNSIVVRIEPQEMISFNEAVDSTLKIVRYLGLLVGRPQNITELSVKIGREQPASGFLRVYWSMPLKRRSPEGEGPHPSDVLIDGVGHPEEFSTVLANWLDRDPEWSDARLRFFNCFADQNHYSVNRLIGSANMFDILPRSAVPSDAELSDEMIAAREKARSAFLGLRQSTERDGVLSVLGRMGKANLKQKVRWRVQRVLNAVGERLSELQMVTDEAVNCRNYFVHGGEPRFDYSKGNIVSFFTEALEFVFATSDLIEAGWDVKRWFDTPTVMSHPLCRFRVTYPLQLHDLHCLRQARHVP
jgi:hypothetical protein